MATLTQKLRGKGFYILDEPEAALSPTRRIAALSAIHLPVEDESQFIIATHSPILPAYPRSRILLLDKNGTRLLIKPLGFLAGPGNQAYQVRAYDSLPVSSEFLKKHSLLSTSTSISLSNASRSS